MRKGDVQLGYPNTLYANTQAAIEALTGVPEGAVAYATDQPTLPFGAYTGGAWQWTGAFNVVGPASNVITLLVSATASFTIPQTGTAIISEGLTAGNQVIYGSQAANGDLTLEGTSHATKTTSYVILQPTSGFVGIQTLAPRAPLEINGNVIINSTGDEKVIYTASRSGSLGMTANSGGSFAASGPYFGMRGIEYTANPTQRGNLFFSAGNPTSPATGEGEIRYFTGAEVTRLTIDKDGLITVGTVQGTARFNVIGLTDIVQQLVTGYSIQADVVSRIQRNDGNTNAIANTLDIQNKSTGTVAAGFGVALLLSGESATADSIKSMGRVYSKFIVPTAYDYNGERIGFAVESDGSAAKIGFFGHAAALQPAAYTPSNVSTDRSYDANVTSIDELADVLGTLIADLQTMGVIG